MKSTLKKDNTVDQHTGYLGTSRVVLNHFDVSTQADFQHQQILNYGSEDEIIGRLYAKEKKLITPSSGSGGGGGSTLYSKQDIREQYCISERGLGALENNDNNNNDGGKPIGIFGCISSHHNSPCSVRGSPSFLLTACVKQKVSSDENLYELYKRHPSEYAPYPKKQRYLWAPLTSPSSSDLYRHDIDVNQYRSSVSNFQRTNHRQPHPYYNNYHYYYYGDPSNYNTWMPPADDESVRMEKPKSILDLSYYRNQSSVSSEKKHVSFARSHTLTSFDDAVTFLNNTPSSSSAAASAVSAQHLNYGTSTSVSPIASAATRSHERLLDVRKTEMINNSTAITKQPELSENILILDKIKRTPMKTQATQTEAVLNRKSIMPNNIGHHANLSPRTIQKVKMVSQAAQTNGINNGRKLAKSFSEAGNKVAFLPNNKDNEIPDHEPLHRTQSDEPPRAPFIITTTVQASQPPATLQQRISPSPSINVILSPPQPSVTTTTIKNQRCHYHQQHHHHQSAIASESSSIASRSEDHDESEDSVESKKEIFINFKPQQEMNGTKRPLIKTVSDGVLLAEQRRHKKIENSTIINSNGIRRCNSISRESFKIEERRPFVPYFQNAPIRNEGICKPFDDTNVYSSTDGGFYGQDSLDEEFHENFIYNKKYINRQDSETTTNESIKKEPDNDESVVPTVSDLKLSASNDSLTNEAKDQSDGIWNESQATVLQIDTENGTSAHVSSELGSFGTGSLGTINLLTPSSKRKHLLLLQHQQRSSFDTETLDEELENQQQEETTSFPRIAVDRSSSTTNNNLDVPFTHLKPMTNSQTLVKSNRPSTTKSSELLLNSNIRRKIPAGAETAIETVATSTTIIPSSESVVPILPPAPSTSLPLAESPLPAVVPDLLLARTDSCKTNTDLSESTTTDDYITATSGTDSSRKSGSFKGNEKYKQQQQQQQHEQNRMKQQHQHQQKQQQFEQYQQEQQQQHLIINQNDESSFDSAKGSIDIAEDMVVPSISPRRSSVSPIKSPTDQNHDQSAATFPGGGGDGGRSSPISDNDNDDDDDEDNDDGDDDDNNGDDDDESSSCGSYSVGASIPDLLDKYSVSFSSPKKLPSSPWHRGSDDDNDKERRKKTQKKNSWLSVDDSLITNSSALKQPPSKFINNKSNHRNDFHLDLTSNSGNKSKWRTNKSSSALVGDGFKNATEKQKRNKSKTRISPLQSTATSHKKSPQGRKSSAYREVKSLNSTDDKNLHKQIDDDDDDEDDDDGSSTGREYPVTQTSPRKSKKTIKDMNRRRSLPRSSPINSKTYCDRKANDYDHYNTYHSPHHHHHHHSHSHHHHHPQQQHQSISLPGSLCRRKSSTKCQQQQQSSKNHTISTIKDPIATNTTTLKAISAESLRSVSPGSDSVFYSDPSSHQTIEHHLHCLYCGKEVDLIQAATSATATATATTDEPDKSLSEAIADGLQHNIVEPPAGFEDSPKTTVAGNVGGDGSGGGGGGGGGGRLFKKVDKRTKSQDEKGQGEQHRRHHRHHKSDVRAKSEERTGGSSSATTTTTTGSSSTYKNKLRPMSRSPFCSREHLLKTTTSSPSILPGSPYNEDEDEGENDQGIYNAYYEPGIWLFIDERDEVQGGIYPGGTEQQDQQIRKSSVSSTESEQDFRKRYQSVTHRMVHRKSCLEMFKKQNTKSFECDKTVIVHRETNGEFGFRIHGSKPVVVSAIESGTPAEQSGLEVGDIVLSVNGVSVLEKTHSDVVKIAHAGSDTLTLEVARTCYALSSKNCDQLDNNTLYCGYLWKLSGFASGTINNNKWIRRWFCLKQNNCLYYYKTDNDKQPVGVIMLFEHEVLELNNDDNNDDDTNSQSSKSNRFVIQRDDTVPLHLAADTAYARNRWIEVIGQAIANSNLVDQFLDQTKQNLNLAPHAITNPDCSGNLIKLGTQWKSWSRPYCILKDACLYFYQDVNATSAFGIAYLQGYKVQQSLTGSKKHAFEIVPFNSGKRCYYFHAESETDKKRWITALEYSIDKWLKIS